MIKKHNGIILLLCLTSVFYTSCSVNDLISNALSNSLSGGGDQPNPLLSENDPELVGDALPFTLKLLDIMIASDINSPEILLVASQAYVAYASLFLQSEANTNSYNDFARRSRLLDRAKIHYLRSRDYALDALEQRHPNFIQFLNESDYDNAFSEISEEDVPYLYFAALGWIGAAAIDVFDLELVLTAQRAVAMIDRAFELQPDYGNGSIHEFYIIYFSSLPEAMGGDDERAAYHYEQALELSNNLSAAAHLSMALGIALPAQDIDKFREFLDKALAIDPNQDLNRRLQNLIRQREARWYLDNLALFFVDTE